MEALNQETKSVVAEKLDFKYPSKTNKTFSIFELSQFHDKKQNQSL